MLNAWRHKAYLALSFVNEKMFWGRENCICW